MSLSHIMSGTDDSSLIRMEEPLRVESRMLSILPLELSSSSCLSPR